MFASKCWQRFVWSWSLPVDPIMLLCMRDMIVEVGILSMTDLTSFHHTPTKALQNTCQESSHCTSHQTSRNARNDVFTFSFSNSSPGGLFNYQVEDKKNNERRGSPTKRQTSSHNSPKTQIALSFPSPTPIPPHATSATNRHTAETSSTISAV